MVNRISAQIIADSINTQGDRLTTYVLVFPRIVLAEFNTHRMISKNSASSRAIPFKTMLKRVQEEPFVPIAFQKEHKGMQGIDIFEGEELIEAQRMWKSAAFNAAVRASELSEFGVTKQLANRQLEPYLYHTVICTGTEWENFFALRAHPAAEIHIADLAEKMLIAYNESTPKLLQPKEWHIPFGDTFDTNRLFEVGYEMCLCLDPKIQEAEDKHNSLLKVKIATARCARVSYLNFEGKDDYAADIKLHDTLADMGHRSPFEHCGQAMTDEEYYAHAQGKGYNPYDEEEQKIYFEEEQFGWSGNFKGFIQYRKMFQGENKTDSRVLKK